MLLQAALAAQHAAAEPARERLALPDALAPVTARHDVNARVQRERLEVGEATITQLARVLVQLL